MVIMDYRKIVNKLLAIRKKAGLTQNEVAELAGLSNRTYADIERGTVNMRVETVLRICMALHITPDEIFTEEASAITAKKQELLERLEADGKITYGSNVKEVTTQVSEASADAGIIYATDAFSAGLTVVDEAGEDLCRPVIYPAAVLKTSEEQAAAQAFLDYLRTDACMEVFGEVGFSAAQ